MAKVLLKNNFKILQLTRKEYIACTDDFGTCHLCGDECQLDETMYYLPILDIVYCSRCFALWLVSAKHYKVDEKIEEKNLEKLTNKLKDMGVLEQ